MPRATVYFLMNLWSNPAPSAPQYPLLPCPQALRHGWWLLLDEINLASSEVLERIAGILDGAAGAGSITLVERGDTQQVGKSDLPAQGDQLSHDEYAWSLVI